LSFVFQLGQTLKVYRSLLPIGSETGVAGLHFQKHSSQARFVLIATLLT
jgi:hypothetical protein